LLAGTLVLAETLPTWLCGMIVVCGDCCC
jgi:hypothetical protein